MKDWQTDYKRRICFDQGEVIKFAGTDWRLTLYGKEYCVDADGEPMYLFDDLNDAIDQLIYLNERNGTD